MFAKALTHARKHMPQYLIISTIVWTIHIVLNWDGRITPITWLIMIAITAIILFAIGSTVKATLKFMWSLIK